SLFLSFHLFAYSTFLSSLAFFFFYRYVAHRDFHSFPTRRSSDLVDLIAGAAPSEKVCWIVGRAGTILLTTDAGSHWALLHSPLEEDLGGVRATDALHAAIWNLGNTKAWKTPKGGVGGRPAASRERGAAFFRDSRVVRPVRAAV